MIGNVDQQARALIEIEVHAHRDLPATTVVVWIDTAFDGYLVFPIATVQQLKLEALLDTEAILADGSKVKLETFVCYLDWFGECIPVQVIANDGSVPLLGTELLKERVLHIDYVQKSLALD